MAEIVKLKDGTKELYPVTVGQAVMLEHGTLQNELDTKQDILVSGTNIKTINNEPIIGEGNITIDAPDNVALISDDLSVDSTTHIQASEIEYGSTNVANALNTMRTTTRTYLLSPTGWNDGVYTIESEFITLESTQDILPTVDILPDQLEALQAANIIDGGQANGKLYLRAIGDIPLIELPIRIIFRGELAGSTLQDASTVSGNVVPFSFGVDADGNYGYIKAGADSVTPFKNGVSLDGYENVNVSGYSSAAKDWSITNTLSGTYLMIFTYAYVTSSSFTSSVSYVKVNGVSIPFVFTRTGDSSGSYYGTGCSVVAQVELSGNNTIVVNGTYVASPNFKFYKC